MKTAVITGVDHGLGTSFAKRLLKDGWQVIGGYFLSPHDELMALLEDEKNNLHLIQVDIGSDRSVRNFAGAIKDLCSSVDLILNNAGVLGNIEGNITDTIDYEDLLNTLNVNAVGSLRVIQSLYEMVVKSTLKAIVNISSEAGSIANNTRDGWFGYGMSKAALNMAGSMIHQSLKPLGGQVMLIHPGYLRSFMHGHYNEQGHLATDDAAKMILEVIFNQLEKEAMNQPVYLDYKGEALPW